MKQTSRILAVGALTLLGVGVGGAFSHYVVSDARAVENLVLTETPEPTETPALVPDQSAVVQCPLLKHRLLGITADRPLGRRVPLVDRAHLVDITEDWPLTNVWGTCVLADDPDNLGDPMSYSADDLPLGCKLDINLPNTHNTEFRCTCEKTELGWYCQTFL